MPDFSVVTALKLPLRSLSLFELKNQLRVSVEHVIVVTGNCAKSHQLLVQYENDSHGIAGLEVKIIFGAFNLWDALDCGIEAAGGELICFLHDDDRFASDDSLAKLKAKFKGGITTVYSGVRVKTKSGTRTVLPQMDNAHKLFPLYCPPHTGIAWRSNAVANYKKFSQCQVGILKDIEWTKYLMEASIDRDFFNKEILTEMAYGGITTAGFSTQIFVLKEKLKVYRSQNPKSLIGYIRFILSLLLKRYNEVR